MPDFPVPVRIGMKNFCSHINNMVEFGAPSEKVFVRGETGQGKSQIFNAIKYALGKKKENDEEVFTYDEVLENGEKKRNYRNETQLILTLKNSGMNPLKQFPPDSEFSVEAHFTQGKKTQYYLIQPGGAVKTLISREDLKQFGKYDDPLLFVDQAQTAIWTQMNPEERFRRVSSLIGIEENQKKVKETLLELQKADERLVEHHSKYDVAKIQFNEIDAKFKRYQVKETIAAKLESFQRQHTISLMWDAFQLHRVQEENLRDCDSQIQSLNDRKQTLEGEIADLKKEIQKHDETLDGDKKYKDKLGEEQTSKVTDVRNFETDLATCKQKLEQMNLDPKTYNMDQISAGYTNAKQELSEINGQIAHLNTEKRDIQKRIKKLMADQPDLPEDVVKLENALAKNHISHEPVFATIELRPEAEKWRDIIESFLDARKKEIVVEPQDRLNAEQINRQNNFDAGVITPRKDIPRKVPSQSKFKTWEDILFVQSEIIREITVKLVLDYLFGGVFFADTPEEKEIILDSTRARVLCLDNYLYDSFSQRRIHDPRDYCIGKNAKKLEIQRLSDSETALSNEITTAEESQSNAEKELIKYQTLEHYEELQNRLPEITSTQARLAKIKMLFEQIVIKMADPLKYKADLNKKLTDATESLSKIANDLHINQDEFAQVQTQLNESSTTFQNKFTEIRENLQKFKDFVDPSFNSINFSDYLVAYEDVKIKYIGLKKELLGIKKLFKMPESTTELIAQNILTHSAELKGYSDVSPDTPEIFQKMKANLEQYETELANYTSEYQRCDTQYTEAQDTLRDRLEKWRRDVSKNFGKVMQGLQLDGDLNFVDLDGEGSYGLNFNVANSIGGAKSFIEKSNFSGGEKQRTNIAFIIAIIIQTQYTYLIWDEPDSAIGEPYREMLAKVIGQFFQNRKLILASPQRIVQGYLKVFDQIIEVYKDGNNQSHITKVLLTDEYRKEKGVLNVKILPKM